MMLRVCSRMCSTCIGRPLQQKVHLGDRVIEEALRTGTSVTCHATLDLPKGTVEGMGGEQAVCKFFFDKHSDDVDALQVIKRLGLIKKVQPPKKERS